jgi:diaminopimelate decarboxylase
MQQQPTPSSFLGGDACRAIREQFGSPVYVYSEEKLQTQALKTLAFPRDEQQPFRVRFAMKACPNAAILQTFDRAGLNFDASSGYEVKRAMRAGIAAEKISLSSQELPADFKELMSLGIEFNACSLHQLEEFGKHFPGGKYIAPPC